jgi:hypothetical protein
MELEDFSDDQKQSSGSKMVKREAISWLRSEPMALCQMFLQSESTYACINLLGEIGMTQFRDLNSGVNAFQRKFVNELRRCNEMERQLSYVSIFSIYFS